MTIGDGILAAALVWAVTILVQTAVAVAERSAWAKREDAMRAQGDKALEHRVVALEEHVLM